MRGFMNHTRSGEQTDRALESHASGAQGCRHHRRGAVARVLGILGFVSVVGGEAWATTADGALLTNIAAATYSSSSKVGFAVSYCATVPILIRNPSIVILKSATPTMQSPGSAVTYTLCVINCGSGSATNVTVTDKLPDNVGFTGLGDEVLPPGGGWWTDDFSGPPWGFWTNYAWTYYESANGAAYVAGTPPVGQVTPYYLRWVLNQLGPGCQSAYVQYTATIL